MPYTVTRQVQWPDGSPVVEVSRGGIDYTNPDALVAKYPGEFQEYEDPGEAVDAAIAICKAWRQDGERRAKVGIGATMGMTMPFEPISFKEARRWSQRERERLPKCDRCGDILSDRYYTNGLDEARFCREFCAEVGS